MNDIYRIDGPPQLIPSFVCYADILGYSSMCKQAINTGNGLSFLRRLYFALSNAYDLLRENRESYNRNSGVKIHFCIKIFTDNIVIGYPKESLDGIYEFYEIINIFSIFQSSLASEGFLVRGGIAFGDHFMDDDVVFGDAFLEAVKQDRHNSPPYISLSPSAQNFIQDINKQYKNSNNQFLFHDELLKDNEGTIFLNYLEIIYNYFPDDSFFYILRDHKSTIEDGLNQYSDQPKVKLKYEWAAEYHNFICKEFIDLKLLPITPHEDIGESMRLDDYIITVENSNFQFSRIMESN